MDQLTVTALRAKAGDRQALDDFVAETLSDVLGLCRYLGKPSDPEDLAQETYARALGAIHRFRGDGSARAWLLSIARRVCADATRIEIRSRKLDERLVAQLTTTDHHDHRWVEIEGMLSVLDENRKSAFVLTQLLGLSYEEAAEAMACPVGTIRSRVARARQQLIDVASVSEGDEVHDWRLRAPSPLRETGN
jgi:RNA polymerase sigma-70 factor (ECF subfamily)